MLLTRSLPLLAGALALSGCATLPAPVALPQAKATLLSPEGQPRGMAAVRQTALGLEVTISAEGLPAGQHGVHIHTTGRCDPPGFTSAGGHWNPAGRQHGSMNPQGPHGGDLGNLAIGADGRGQAVVEIPGASLTGGAEPLLDADGAAVVIHAGPDDLRSDPAGNSGARVACGVLQPA